MIHVISRQKTKTCKFLLEPLNSEIVDSELIGLKLAAGVIHQALVKCERHWCGWRGSVDILKLTIT